MFLFCSQASDESRKLVAQAKLLLLETILS
jgi:hypothetical protein